MQITTYQSIKAWPEKRWLASLDIGNNLLMSFFAKTEQEAIDAANRWWELRMQREAELNASPFNSEAVIDGREALGGKLWMLNRMTGHRARINASELALYEGRGYVKGGPRSK